MFPILEYLFTKSNFISMQIVKVGCHLIHWDRWCGDITVVDAYVASASEVVDGRIACAL
jgi:hypothetical protein